MASAPAHLAAGPVACAPVRLAALFGLLLAALLLAGCAQNPNANLSTSACCEKSAETYRCHVQMDSNGNAVKDNNGNIQLADCGDQCKMMSPESRLLDGLGRPLVRSDNSPFGPSDCASNCNFRRTDCQDVDGKHTCYQLEDNGQPKQDPQTKAKISVAPICTQNLKPDPCVQNNCTAIACGKPLASSRLPIDRLDIANAGKGGGGQNAYVEEAAREIQTGLVGRVCQQRAMDGATSRLLRTGDWFVNSMRLGVAGDFSTYDRARFYLPPSDYFCSPTNPLAVVDRFTNYLDGENALAPFRAGRRRVAAGCLEWRDSAHPATRYICNTNRALEYPSLAACQGDVWDDAHPARNCRDGMSVMAAPDYQADITLCKPGIRADGSEQYVCTADASLSFPSGPAGSAEQRNAYVACNQACNAFRQRTCADNPELKVQEVLVSPPATTPPRQEPFVDLSKYMAGLERAYPAPQAVDYYKKQYVDNDPRNREEAAKPGPAGGKVFECLQGSDCLSGACDIGRPGDAEKYVRSSCYNATSGESIDCGCRVVTQCDYDFQCSKYPPGSMDRTLCLSDRQMCKLQLGDTVGRAVVCRYAPATEPVSVKWSQALCDKGYGNSYCNYGFSGNPPNRLIMDYRAQEWGVKDFEEFHKYSGYGQELELSNLRRNIDGVWLDDPRTFERCLAAHDWDLGECKDERDQLDAVVRNEWYYSWAAVPDWQAVSGPDGPAYFITSRTGISWQNDDCRRSISGFTNDGRACPAGEVKFPLIRACNMKLKKDDCPLVTPAGGKCDRQTTDAAPDIEMVTEERYAGSPDSVPGHVSVEDHVSYHDRTWKINSFGDCQMGPNPAEPRKSQLTVGTYGVCKPCGTVLSMAYQPVKNWDALAIAQAPVDLGNSPVAPGDIRTGITLPEVGAVGAIVSQDSGQARFWDQKGVNQYNVRTVSVPDSPDNDYPLQMVGQRLAAYCPDGCRGGPKADGKACGDCAAIYPKPGFSPFASGAPATDPEYGFLTWKIHEYQSAGIMPVLDLRGYRFGAPQARTIWTASKAGCSEQGGMLGGSHCLQTRQGSDGEGNPLAWCVNSVWKCDIPGENDWLLGFLAKNHSAAILLLDDLPADCPAASAEPDPASACQKARERVRAARTACPACQLALEYPLPLGTVKETGMEKIYPADLQARLQNWDPTHKAVFKGRIAGADPDSGNPAYEVGKMTVPWPAGKPAEVADVSLLVLRIDMTGMDSGHPSEADRQTEATINLSRHVLQQIGWPTIWKMERTDADRPYLKEQYLGLMAHARSLSTAGVVGVLLPDLSDDLAAAHAAGGELCPAEEGSKQFLHPQILSTPKKVEARARCACVKCTKTEIDAGLCGTEKQICEDGQTCDAGTGGRQDTKCESLCVRQSYCDAHRCSQATTSTTCIAIRSANTPPTAGNGGIRTQTLKSFSNPLLEPDAPGMIAGMPGGEFCCLWQGKQSYTYRALASVMTSSEPDIFPAFGANTTDCGRVPAGLDNPAPICSGSQGVALPISNTLWVCTKPA